MTFYESINFDINNLPLEQNRKGKTAEFHSSDNTSTKNATILKSSALSAGIVIFL
jgi:hypothetical protein